MIVFANRQPRVLVFTPPHTASRTIHQALQQAGGQWHWTETPDGAGYLDHHGCKPPAEYNDATIVLAVRHPLDRLVGLWKHWQTWYTERYPKNKLPLTFEQFVVAVATDDDRKLSWLYRWTITRLCPPSVQPAKLIRYETLEQDIRAIAGRDVTITARFTEPHDWTTYYTTDLGRQAVAAWAWQDAHRFDYPIAW